MPGIERVVANDETKIKHCYAIVSGKGGVGKSFVTSLLASRARAKGYKVGILDGDIVGPSIPKLFNIHEVAYGNEKQHIVPALTESGIKIISSNLMVEHEDDPIIWRGSLVTSLLKQFYTEVAWGDVDFLFLDMPPGTSDVTLTAFQSIPIDGVIIVTSPQELVSLIVKKAIKMAKMMNIPIIGIVENMSYLECPHCKEKINLYGKSKLEEYAKENELTPLCALPLRPDMSELLDSEKVEEVAKHFDEIDKVLEVLEK